MSSTSNSAAAAAAAGGGTIDAIHSDIIQSHILNRLDGPSLAAASCSSPRFLSLCKDDHLWKDICNSTWPSTTGRRVGDAISAFPSGYRSFYSDAFPAVRHYVKTHPHRLPAASELISVVDIYYDDVSIHSKVLVTETLSSWFLNTPFRLELFDSKETTPWEFDHDECASTTRAKERVRVSWILIDPVKRRAVNVASRKAVEARRHWLTDDIQLTYASVLAAGDGDMVACMVVVTCGGKDGRVMEVSMQVEEIEGRILTGMESLRILEEAMEGDRWKSDVEQERDIYEKFTTMKVRRRERKQKRESGLDMVCTAAGICVVFAFWIFFWSI